MGLLQAAPMFFADNIFCILSYQAPLLTFKKKLIRWMFPVNTYKKGKPPKCKRKKMPILKLYGKWNVLAYTQKKQTVKTACLLHG